MIFAFQDRENLYLVMDLLTGGDLRFHISKKKKFTEEQTSPFFSTHKKFKNHIKLRIFHRLHNA